jgi:ParB family chromosome partitioning protein
MSGALGHIELDRSIESIRVGARHRHDLGDIEALAASIERQGLLQPVTVTPDGDLICGARRLAALRLLGHRRVSVWVRSGISDDLARLLAEQDDNALHKSLAPTEAAALYREVKQLLAEDAERRQLASRFQAGRGRPDGAAPGAAPSPRGSGDTRSQAARLVSGNHSYNTHERIGRLQQIVDDETAPPEVRAEASRALESIDGGAPVKPALLAVTERIRTIEGTGLDPSSDLRHLAQTALARVTAEPRARRRGLEPAGDAVDPVKLPTRAFVLQWSDLHEWWRHFDAKEIAAALTEEQWQQVEVTLAGTIAFTDRLRELRSQVVAAAG